MWLVNGQGSLAVACLPVCMAAQLAILEACFYVDILYSLHFMIMVADQLILRDTAKLDSFKCSWHRSERSFFFNSNNNITGLLETMTMDNYSLLKNMKTTRKRSYQPDWRIGSLFHGLLQMEWIASLLGQRHYAFVSTGEKMIDGCDWQSAIDPFLKWLLQEFFVLFYLVIFSKLLKLHESSKQSPPNSELKFMFCASSLKRSFWEKKKIQNI